MILPPLELILEKLLGVGYTEQDIITLLFFVVLVLGSLIVIRKEKK